MIRRVVLGLVVFVGLAAAAVFFVPAVQDALMMRVVRQAGQTANHLFGEDSLRVLLCGTSSPMPARDRARPCVAVFAGGKFYIVDIASGGWNNLALWRIPPERIGAAFLTHFHSDHIGELGELNMQTWVAGRPGPLAVYGPAGIERVVDGFNEAYALDRGYRTAHHGAEALPPENGVMQAMRVNFEKDGPKQTVALQSGDLTVTAFLVDHAPIAPAVGYRFDYKGRSVVVSGDTVRSENLIRVAKGADVLLHEAQNNELVAAARDAMKAAGRDQLAKLLGDIPSYHTSPVDVAKIANEAGVRLLVMYHLTPPPPNVIGERVFLRGVAEVRPEATLLAYDGLLLEMPAQTEQILKSKLK